MTLHLIFPAELAQHLLCQQIVSVRDFGQVCWEDLSITESNMASLSSLQSTTVLINSVVPTYHSQQEGAEVKFNTHLRLNREVEMDLTWWSSLDRKIPLQSPLYPRTPSMTIESHASNMGWRAARQGEHQTGGRWSREEALHHINYLELLAAFLALQCFAKHCHNMTIQMRLDSVTAVTYINKLGGTHSPLLCQLVLTIWDWCLQREIFLLAEQLSGKDNVVVDQESRSMKDRCDWMLNPVVFNQIQLQMGTLEINLFAPRLTKQLPSFYSWRPDPEAQGTDAFCQDWSQMRGFANPLWCLRARCLSQVKRQVARVVMITPLWTSQPWYPTILGMLEDFPRILPARDNLQTEQEFIINQY